MEFVKTKDGKHGVQFIENGGNPNEIIAIACLIDDNGEKDFWFSVGWYKSLKSAKTWANKQMRKLGHELDL